MSAAPLGRHAVVLGGSLAGLLAARALAGHFDRVTVLERDRYPDGPGPRKGVPQARHLHVLLLRGRQLLAAFFPGLFDDLAAAGAETLDAAADLAWLTPAGWGVRYRSGIGMLAASRDLIDWAVRRRLAADGRVTLREGAEAAGLRTGPAGRAVTGVAVRGRGDGGPEEVVEADLVVDASGRASRLPQWLEALGYPAPPETVVDASLGYASRVYRRPEGFAADWRALYLQSAPPVRKRAGVILPIEGGRWIVTLGGGGGDYPPTDEAGFLAFADSLPDPRFAAALRAAEPLTPIAGNRSTENRLRHYERLKRRPERLLVLGDAACAFNPVYGQGMTTAARGAELLGRCLAESRGDLTGLERRFPRALARLNAAPWLFATGEDYRFRETTGKPAGLATRLLHRYVDRVIALTTRDAKVRQRLLEVFHLLRPPAALFSPGVLLKAALR